MILKILLLLGFLLMIDEALTLDDLKVDYYEKLILKGIQDAQNYKPRTDNSDFFQNVKDEDPIYEYGEFDFIIIGGGSSGAVLATRLSEIQQWRVLLLEAGQPEDDLSDIPGVHVLMPSSERNWGYNTVPQKHGCFGMLNGSCPYARGKSLGGSGAINGLMYVRGAPDDYNRWENEGNPGWSFKDVLPYFKKSENSQIKNADKEYHGFAGPLNNAYSTPKSVFDDIFQQAGAEMGLKDIDYNGKSQIGMGRVQNNINHGKRVSGGVSFVEQAWNRLNFNVTLGAYVTKILLNKERAAHGVLFVKDGRKYIATNKKEIILSGGSVNTPQLLMLSGIGPKNELTKHNIETLVDLPVGQFMKDHIAYTNLYFRTNYTEPSLPLRSTIKDYLKGRGTLTVSFGSKSIALINIDSCKSKVPDIEIVIVPPNGKKNSGLVPRNFNKDILKAISTVDSQTDFVLSAILLHPKSTGKITLKSNNPIDFPQIDIGIFNAEEDVEKIYKGIRYAIKMTQTAAFQKYNATVFFPLEPCLHFGFNTKDFWTCAIRHVAFNSYHMTSTAKMGPPHDPLAVVDHKLRVYGVGGLRVADCSVIPVTVSGHTNAAAFMIGEKAADIIKNDHGVLDRLVNIKNISNHCIAPVCSWFIISFVMFLLPIRL